MTGTLGAVRALHEDLLCHGGSPTNPGFIALAGYRFGRWRAELRNPLLRKLLRPPYVAVKRHARNSHRIELHYTADIGRRVRFSGRGDIVIGSSVAIGDGSSIGHGVTIGKTRHDASGWPVLGSDVTIGPGAVVAGDLRVGDGAVVGPNAVVLADVPAAAEVAAREAVVEPRPSGTVVTSEGPYWRMPRWPTSVVHRLRLRSRRIHVGRRVRVGADVRLHREGRVTIHDGASLGDGCRLGYGVTIGWSPAGSLGVRTQTQLGRRVSIASGATVLAGVRVGDDASIGPNAVVATDVPPAGSAQAPSAGLLRPLHPRPSARSTSAAAREEETAHGRTAADPQGLLGPRR